MHLSEKAASLAGIFFFRRLSRNVSPIIHTTQNWLLWAFQDMLTSQLSQARFGTHTNIYVCIYIPHTWDASCMWPDFAFLYITTKDKVKKKVIKQWLRCARATKMSKKYFVSRKTGKKTVTTIVFLNTWETEAHGWVEWGKKKRKCSETGVGSTERNATEPFFHHSASYFFRKEKATGTG